MNVIVKFDSESARQSFVQRARQVWPELSAKSYMARRRPETVIEELSDEELQRLKELVNGLGKLFGDVKFEEMGPTLR